MYSKMKKQCLWGTIFAIVFLLFSNHLYSGYRSGTTPPNYPPAESRFLRDQFIVKFAQGTSLNVSFTPDSILTIGIPSIDARNQIYEVKGLKKIFRTSSERMANYYVFHLSDEKDIESIVNDYRFDAAIELAEPDYLAVPLGQPNDPRYGEQWGLPKIQAEDAWDYEMGDPDVVIAIIDAGVHYHHDDLRPNIWVNPVEDLGGDGIVWDLNDLNGVDDDNNGYIDDLIGWDFYSDDNNPKFYEKHSGERNNHGTVMAGIVAARTNNNLGIAGLAGGWDPSDGCGIMCVRVANWEPNPVAPASAVAAGIEYAATNGARVINMSFSIAEASWINDAIDFADSQGVLMVAAAGNMPPIITYPDIEYPASHSKVLAVTSTKQNDELSGGYFHEEVDVSAPGINILSTINNYPYYQDYNGSSCATAFVSGLCGMLFSYSAQQGYDWSVDDVKRRISGTADEIDADNHWSHWNLIGSGRINGYHAVIDAVHPKMEYVSHLIDDSPSGDDHNDLNPILCFFFAQPLIFFKPPLL